MNKRFIELIVTNVLRGQRMLTLLTDAKWYRHRYQNFIREIFPHPNNDHHNLPMYGSACAQTQNCSLWFSLSEFCKISLIIFLLLFQFH